MELVVIGDGMTRESSLVQRLVSFLKKPDALEYGEGARSSHDDYEEHALEGEAPQPTEAALPGETQSANDASRLDALLVRIVQQFNAQTGYVIRCDAEGQLYYLTGRNHQGNYIEPGHATADRRAIFLALDSGESQFFVVPADDNPVSALCGPLWNGEYILGVLYVENPARSNAQRGMFDLFCDQVARALAGGAMA